MTMTILCDSEKQSEQIKNGISNSLVELISNYIKTDKYNLFKTRALVDTDKKQKESENKISELLKLKNFATTKENELSRSFENLKKINQTQLIQLKKNLNI